MQSVLNVSQYKDLYQLLNALLEIKLNQQAQAQPGQPKEGLSVLLWSAEPDSALLDDPDKLQVIERYAQKLDVRIVLSAASNPRLRQWGHTLGWTVMWEIPGLDNAPDDSLEGYTHRPHSKPPTKDRI